MHYELDPSVYQRLSVIPNNPDGLPEAPRHEPPTAAFLEALHRPDYVAYKGLRYAVYSFNEDKLEGDQSTPPLVVVPPVDQYNGAASRSGCQLLNGLATHLGRRLITIDLPATGNSGRPSISNCLCTSIGATGEMVNHVVDEVGFKGRSVDFMGICLGGAIAASAAVQRDTLARSLLTFGTPGFETDLLQRLSEQARRNTPEGKLDKDCDKRANEQAALYDNLDADYLDIRDLPPIDVRKLRRRIIHGRLGAQLLGEGSLMLTLPDDLHSDTLWHDFVGDSDILTSWQNHVQATRRRGAVRTRQTVLQGVGHNWFMIRAPYTARLAELSLRAISYLIPRWRQL